MSDREALIQVLVAAFQANRVIARSRGNAGNEWDVATLSEARRMAGVALMVLRAERRASGKEVEFSRMDR